MDLKNAIFATSSKFLWKEEQKVDTNVRDVA
jgi:hypothetical protein